MRHWMRHGRGAHNLANALRYRTHSAPRMLDERHSPFWLWLLHGTAPATLNGQGKRPAECGSA